MSVITIKYLHIIFVILTFLSFSIRACWMYTGSDLLRHKAVKIVPHIIDTLLFLSGITMAVMLYGDFYREQWLLFKLLLVIVYIILGSIALKLGKTRSARVAAAAGAWIVFIYIILIAVNHDVTPF